MMLVTALVEDRAECEAWSRELRQRAERDPLVVRQLIAAPVMFVLPAAAFLEQPEWLRIVAVALRDDDNDEVARRLVAATRAFFERDAAACGSAVMEYQAQLSRRFGLPTPALIFARELRRSGATLGPEWERPLAMLREYLERARADWYLTELAKLEA